MSNPNMDAPQKTLWDDRRPIGILWLVERQFVSADNPHGIAPDAGTRVVNAVKLAVEGNFQAVYIHGGFTAKFYTGRFEMQNPLPLPDEWVPRISDMANLFSDAGLRFGCTIKPYLPVGDWDYANERMVYRGDRAMRLDKVQFELSRQVDWCLGQGISGPFYLDSPRFDVDYSWFNNRYPNCLLMPEIVTDRTNPKEQDKLKYGFGYSVTGGHSSLRATGQYCVFPVDHVEDVKGKQTDEQIRKRIRANLLGGDLVAPFCWWHSRGYKRLRDVQQGVA